MSHSRPASTGMRSGRPSGAQAWGLPRSTFYARRHRQASPRLAARRDPKSRHTNEQLAGEIRRRNHALPTRDEGRRKVRARLRQRAVRSSEGL